VASALVGVGAPTFALATGARAVTYLDPMPEKFAAGASHIIGMWVLENATQPVGDDDFGKVGLRLTDETGDAQTFTAVRLREKAHYAVAIALPRGTYRVHALQGVMAPYVVGTLEIPGTFVADPLPRHLRALDGRVVKDHWTQIRPPGFRAIAGGHVRIDADAMLPPT
jgi:hypothetical protein